MWAGTGLGLCGSRCDPGPCCLARPAPRSPFASGSPDCGAPAWPPGHAGNLLDWTGQWFLPRPLDPALLWAGTAVTVVVTLPAPRDGRGSTGSLGGHGRPGPLASPAQAACVGAGSPCLGGGGRVLVPEGPSGDPSSRPCAPEHPQSCRIPPEASAQAQQKPSSMSPARGRGKEHGSTPQVTRAQQDKGLPKATPWLTLSCACPLG